MASGVLAGPERARRYRSLRGVEHCAGEWRKMRVAAGGERPGTDEVTHTEGARAAGHTGAFEVRGPPAIHLGGTGDHLAG
jgi:hypothetical protein